MASLAWPQMGQTFGERLREARLESGATLRDLAKQLNLTASYINDIEYDRRVPSEEVIFDICDLMGLDFEEMMATAGRLGAKAEAYLRHRSDAVRLVRAIAHADLDEAALKRLESEVSRLAGNDGNLRRNSSFT